jgi:hypothetical protein
MAGPPKISTVGLFCEDIREERSGQDTLIGILPDNLELAPTPTATPGLRIISRLCLYIRINVDPSFDPGPLTIRLIYPNGEELTFGPMDPALVKKTREEALADGKPYAGLISKVVLGNFNAKSDGRVRLMLNAGGEDYLCGALNVRLLPAAAASASGPQPSLSPAALPVTKP